MPHFLRRPRISWPVSAAAPRVRPGRVGSAVAAARRRHQRRLPTRPSVGAVARPRPPAQRWRATGLGEPQRRARCRTSRRRWEGAAWDRCPVGRRGPLPALALSRCAPAARSALRCWPVPPWPAKPLPKTGVASPPALFLLKTTARRINDNAAQRSGEGRPPTRPAGAVVLPSSEETNPLCFPAVTTYTNTNVPAPSLPPV